MHDFAICLRESFHIAQVNRPHMRCRSCLCCVQKESVERIEPNFEAGLSFSSSHCGGARHDFPWEDTQVKVFVAGANGAIGRPLVKALLAAGHEVFGMATAAAGVETLQSQGAEGVVLNALDPEAVAREIARIRPRAIIDELTSLPKRYTPDEMKAAARRDRQVRLDGGGNLHRAAVRSGVKRYVVQSTGFFYGPGQGLASENEGLARSASPGVAGLVDTYMKIEERLFGNSGLEGAALRYGFFYGPHTYHDPENGSVTQQVCESTYPVVEPGSGVYSFIHIEDAAAATVAALEIAPGVYNIVDDDPSPLAVWLPAFAKFVGASAPPRVSEQDAVRLHGPDASYYALKLRGASNAKAKREFRFAPRPLEWLAN
jgi:2-alkyl-3-oxoalkanoate reductase